MKFIRRRNELKLIPKLIPTANINGLSVNRLRDLTSGFPVLCNARLFAESMAGIPVCDTGTRLFPGGDRRNGQKIKKKKEKEREKGIENKRGEHIETRSSSKRV